jgi:hypothetical protein
MIVHLISMMGNQTSIRDTTPFVTEMVSPPRGYPTTVTASCPFKMQQKMTLKKRSTYKTI